MLSHIHLKNFAIIEKLDLELKTGMTALTGETGAGKSILIDAIGLVLGDRAESGVVRHGERCERGAGLGGVESPGFGSDRPDPAGSEWNGVGQGPQGDPAGPSGSGHVDARRDDLRRAGPEGGWSGLHHERGALGAIA